MERSNQQNSRSGPGGMLRKARTDLRLPVEDVARLLNLSTRHILAMENDDYASLPGPTYVRGYLRSYAQLLGLSPEETIASYNKLPVASKPVDLTALAPKQEIGSNDRLMKMGTLLIAGVVVGLAVIWWQGDDESPRQADQEVALAPSYQSEAGGATGRDETVDDAAVQEFGPGLIADADNKIPLLVEPEPVMSQEDTSPMPKEKQPPLASPVVVEQPAVPPGVPSDDTGRRASLVRDGETVTSPPAVDTDLGPEGVRARLVLTTEEDSWADIRDARHNKLLYETVPAGRVVTVEGVAPFSVFLGNVEGVRIEFNGKYYDAIKHKRGQVARFTLGETTEAE